MPAIAIAAIGAAVSTGTAIYSGYKQSKALKAQGVAAQQVAESQAQALEANAGTVDKQAADATYRGEQDVNQLAAQIEQVIGTQQTGFAASGVDAGFGSAKDTQNDARFVGAVDARTIRANAAREAWGFKTQAEDYRRQAEITRQGGQASLTAANTAAGSVVTQGYLGAANTGLAFGSSLLMQKYGMFGPAKSKPLTSTHPYSSTLTPYFGSK